MIVFGADASGGTLNCVTWPRTSAEVSAWVPLPDPPRGGSAAPPPPIRPTGCHGVAIPDGSAPRSESGNNVSQSSPAVAGPRAVSTGTLVVPALPTEVPEAEGMIPVASKSPVVGCRFRAREGLIRALHGWVAYSTRYILIYKYIIINIDFDESRVRLADLFLHLLPGARLPSD